MKGVYNYSGGLTFIRSAALPSSAMVREIDLDKASERNQIRVDGNVAAEVVTIANRRLCVWYQRVFSDFKGHDRFCMSETLLCQLPNDVTDVYVKTDENDGYHFKRRDIESALCIDPFSSFFNERPDAPQYAVPIEEARNTFDWPDQKNTEW